MRYIKSLLFPSQTYFEYFKLNHNETNGNSFQQPFAYMIGGRGECAREVQTNSFMLKADFTKIKQKELDFQASLQIYPDQEDVLSYLVQIKFNSLDDLSNASLENIMFGFV